MKIKLMKNIAVIALFILTVIPLVKSNNADVSAAAPKIEKASKVADSLTDVSSKASKFTKVLNSGLSTFSTYVYGVTATMAVIDIIWPGVIPESEPAYVAEMRAYFEILQEEFRIVKDQINDLKNYVQERSTEQIYSNYIITIHSMETYYEEYIDAPASLKEAFGLSFIDNYDQLGNHADKLYTGLTITDDSLNIATNAISYTEGNRAKVLEIMFELFNVISMGIKHEALYYKLKNDTIQIEVLETRWESRMDNLQKIMKDIDNQIVSNANNQMETDFDNEIANFKNNGNSDMATNLYNWFKEKYYWQDWLILVYSSSVKGYDNHAYSYCGSNTVFRKRLGGGVDKTIYMFHVNKASGSWMSKGMAKNRLARGKYTKTGYCYRGTGRYRQRYECQVAITDLSKPIDEVKPDLKVCGVTKGIVILKKTKSYGIAGDDRIKAHSNQQFFNAFAVGPYGSSSPQESVEGYSINGRWTSFTPYSTCTKTCGGGTQTRTRYCRNPVAQDGGRTCSGSNTQTRSCNTFSCFSKTFLTNKIEDVLKNNKGLNNEDFAEKLRDILKNTYTEHRFCVSAYNAIKGSEKHSMRGYSYVAIFRQHGRNVVVAYTKKSSSVPNSSKLKEIEERAVNAIRDKKKNADESRDLAWDELKNEGYRIAMVMVVRFGNGLRTRWTGSGIFFENFNAKGSSKSSLVVMLGKA